MGENFNMSASVRVTLAKYGNVKHTAKAAILPQTASVAHILKIAKNKLKINAKRVFDESGVEMRDSYKSLEQDALLLITCGEDVMSAESRRQMTAKEEAKNFGSKSLLTSANGSRVAVWLQSSPGLVSELDCTHLFTIDSQGDSAREYAAGLPVQTGWTVCHVPATIDSIVPSMEETRDMIHGLEKLLRVLSEKQKLVLLHGSDPSNQLPTAIFCLLLLTLIHPDSSSENLDCLHAAGMDVSAVHGWLEAPSNAEWMQRILTSTDVAVGLALDADMSVSGSCSIRVLCQESFVETEAVQQLNRCAELPGVRVAVGMPDLHPGKGYPIGSAIGSEGFIYPYLIGGDIGCGMSLVATKINREKLTNKKLERWVTKLRGLDHGIDDSRHWLSSNLEWPTGTTVSTVEEEPFGDCNVSLREFDSSLGTVGSGNHFAELQEIEEIVEPVLCESVGLTKEQLYLLVHTGSRGLGAAVLDTHTRIFGDSGLAEHTPQAEAYMKMHDGACAWAKRNRALIASRFLKALRPGAIESSPDCVLDVWHNNVTRKRFDSMGTDLWLHRKGAAPADASLIVIPGSRGSRSYLVQPCGDIEKAGFSLAHGAGRKWHRGKAQQLCKARYGDASTLLKTSLGSLVICDNKDLLYEEAPEAYKEIESIIQDLVQFKLIRVVAVLKPLITYKQSD
eukprot:GILK01009208.1.p1 GENE.GILK01009208.1~~GILK01009208.1.p1  ORF type:complete len:677 (+),score=111.64 GILK01009208.1:19-2049(+)